MDKRELEAADLKKKKKKANKKREREADPKKRKKREVEADRKKKKQKREEEEDPKNSIIRCSNRRRRRSPWEDIPHHLLELFLKPLETVDRPNLSRVCKAWGGLKEPQQRGSCFPEIVLGNIFHLIRGGGIDKDKYPFKCVLGSYDGWLIIRMRRQDDDQNEQLFFLLNLVTKDTIQLPSLLNHNPNFPRILFSSSPTDPDCIALMFDSAFRGFLFTKRGCNNWFQSQCEYPFHSYSKKKEEGFTIDCLYSAIVLGGGGVGGGCTKFYASTFQGILVAIDIDVSDLHHPTTTLTVLPVESIFPIPIADGECVRVGLDWFLVESLGKLLVVRLLRRKIDRDIKDVDVLELDFETMSWSTLKSLPGDQVLFLGLDSSFSISGSKIGIISTSEGGGNCIYVYDDALCKISKYDMHSHELVVCRDFPSSRLLKGYRRMWVRPTYV